MNQDNEYFFNKITSIVGASKAKEFLNKLNNYSQSSNADEILGKCLKCFRPPLSEEKHPGARDAVKSEIQDIALRYHINIAFHKFDISSRAQWKKWRKSHSPIEDDIAESSRERRPIDVPQIRLVMDCKRLLSRYECNCGISRNKDRRYESPLVKLVTLVHELSGQPAMRQRRPWQFRVETILSARGRAKIIGDGYHETGLEDPIQEGDDPWLDAMVKELLESFGIGQSKDSNFPAQKPNSSAQ